MESMSPDFTGDNGYSKPYSASHAIKRKNGKSIYDQTFDLPDQIESIAKISGGILDKQAEISFNYQDRVRSIGQKFGISQLVLFSLSGPLMKIMEKITAYHEVLTSVHSHLSSYAVGMSPFWKEMAGATTK
jgi:hypothetical protein